MKRVFILLTISATAAAGLALFAESSVGPVQATTFPSPTLIYTATGVRDFNNTVYAVGTSVACVNQSGQSATVRWRFINETGADKGSATQIVPNGRTVTISTAHRTEIYVDTPVSAALNFQGRVAVYSTQSAVFCTAVVAESDDFDSGNTLHMVRFNPHPGTVG